jgi:uncharacterized repeat protein (TIGR02543 family)
MNIDLKSTIIILFATLLSSCSSPNSYSITFDSNGGSPVNEIITDGKSEIQMPQNPTREGYDFLGWFYDDITFLNPFSTNSLIDNPISDNLTIYANWDALTFTITFNAMNGSPISQHELKTDEKIIFPDNPSKPGFTFGGWFLDSKNKFLKTKMPPNNVNLFAKWLTAYEVYYNSLNLDELESSYDNAGPYKIHKIRWVDNDYVTRESIAFYLSGAITYTYYHREGRISGGNIYEQTWIHTIKTHIDDIKSFRIYMSENRVTKKPDQPQTSIKYESEATNGKLINTITYEATYTFNSTVWELINHNDDPDELIKDFYSNLIKVFSNVFTINDYTIVFVVNGGGNLPPMKVTKNTLLNLPTPIKIGFSFKGWFTDIDLTEKFTLIRMPSYDLKLYAKWEINQYTITFVTNGGTAIPAITGNYGNQVVIPEDPVREQAIFAGWYKDMELTQLATIPNTIPGYNLTVYAKWIINQYTITFETNSEDFLPNQTYSFDETLILPSPTKNGHGFEGWFFDYELTQPFSLTKMPSYNLTLYAKWSINQYSISYTPIAFDKGVLMTSGNSHTFLFTTSGRVLGWGLNDYGQLGDGTTVNKSNPTLINFVGLESQEKIETIIAGESHTFLLTNNGRVLGWGLNDYGQLGDGTTINKSNPTPINFDGLDTEESIESVSAALSHSLAVTTTGRVFAWGLNNYGQLGDGTTVDKSNPTLINFDGLESQEKIETIIAGESHSLAVTTTGRVFAWGWNAGGQLGDGTKVNSFFPKEIKFSDLENGEQIKEITAGWASTHALTSFGRMFAWGWNGDGQLGDGTTIQKSIPTLIPFPGLNNGEQIQTLTANFNGATTALTTNGRLYAWGFNGNGQLANGSTTNNYFPTLVTFNNLQNGEILSFSSLGSYHMNVITSRGRLYSSGFNGDAALGIGTQTNTNTLIPTSRNLNLITTYDVVYNYYYLDYQELMVLPEPYMEGYVFKGWYIDEALTTPFNLTFMGDENLQLYAWFIPSESQLNQ